MHRSPPILLLLILFASCGWQPGSYPPPRQRSLDLGKDPIGVGSFVRMDENRVADHIVRDISMEKGVFRWAFKNPEMKFRVEDSQEYNFVLEITEPEATFKTTGPITVWSSINGHEIGSIRCPKAGEYRLEKPVPAGWIEPKTPIYVTFRTEPRWVSPEDGGELSFLLRSVGFVPR